MPTPLELQLMQQFLEQNEIAIADAGYYPLITYYGPVKEKSLQKVAAVGQHLRVTCIAAREGIPFVHWPNHVLNLNDDHDDLVRLAEKPWLPTWNGVWFHQSHGNPGTVMVNGLLTGKKFYDGYGKYLMEEERFRYGIIKTCYGARLSNSKVNRSLIEDMVNSAVTPGRLLYGSQVGTWIPLSGPCRGRALTSLRTFHNKYKDNFGDYFTGDLSDINFRLDEAEEVDAMTPQLTGLYYEEAEFRPERALPISSRPDTLLGSGSDTNWYGTF